MKSVGIIQLLASESVKWQEDKYALQQQQSIGFGALRKKLEKYA